MVRTARDAALGGSAVRRTEPDQGGVNRPQQRGEAEQSQVVPKNGMGIAFLIDGAPGGADIVNVEVPSAIAASIVMSRGGRGPGR